MNNASYIYAIKNLINGKMYIGKHCGSDDDYFGSGVALSKAVKKYGKSNFVKEIIELCSESELNEREVYWIAYYNTYNGSGYNLTPGGDGWTVGMKHKKESIEKISKSKKGKVTISEQQKELIKASLRSYYDSMTPEERKNIYGKGGRAGKGIKKAPFTEQHKLNLSKSQKGKKKKQTKEHRQKIGLTKRKQVEAYTVDGKLVETYSSMTEAAKKINGNISEISKSCKDGKTTVKGFLFKLK